MVLAGRGEALIIGRGRRRGQGNRCDPCALVKLAGAVYRLTLGVRALVARPGDAAARAFRQAIPAEVLNPQTALSFPAVLRQFVRADRAAPFAQFVVLGLKVLAQARQAA